MTGQQKGNLMIILVGILFFIATNVVNAQERDTFNSDALVEIQFQGQPNTMTIEASGLTTIARQPQLDGGSITEITNMRLIAGGGIIITKDPQRRSMGRIAPPVQQEGGGPLVQEASFSVFARIQTPLGIFFNDIPIPLATVIDDNVPPLSNTYRFVGIIPLRGPRAANILRVFHHPRVPGSPGGTPRATLSPYLVGVWQLRDFPNMIPPAREDTLITIINPTSGPLSVLVRFLDDSEQLIACGRVVPPLTANDMVEVNVRQFFVSHGIAIPPGKVGVVKAVSFLPPGPPQLALVKTGIIAYLKNFITDGDDPADMLSPFERAVSIATHAKEELKPVPDKELNLRVFLNCPPALTFDIPNVPALSPESVKTKAEAATKKQNGESSKTTAETARR